MGIPQLRESCCGCNLQTGSKIIGWFHCVMAVIGLICLCLVVAAGNHIEVQTSQGPRIIDNPFYGSAIAALIGVIISLIIASCLLYGAYNRTPGHCLAWVIYNTISTTICLVGALYGCGNSFSAGQAGIGAGNLIGGLIGAALNIYLLLVVYSFYRELKQGSKNVATYNTA